MFYYTNYGVSLVKVLHTVKNQFYTCTLCLNSISEIDSAENILPTAMT